MTPERGRKIDYLCLGNEITERFEDGVRLQRALPGCACAGDWGQKHAARGWRGRPVPGLSHALEGP
jgi:hypothetical protein